jgi:hypothetical protein
MATCCNVGINDIEEQKKYLLNYFRIINQFDYIFMGKWKKVNSISELIKKFEELILGNSI